MGNDTERCSVDKCCVLGFFATVYNITAKHWSNYRIK